jgi:NAD-dependent deacetylase
LKKRIVILSGAGISAESGISTFRDANGLWENHNIEDVATPQAWLKNPDLVTAFYNKRRKQVLNSKPNQAHLFFQELEKKYTVQIVTQNIDDLHERAGSKKVLHLHGSIMEAISSKPTTILDKKVYPVRKPALSARDVCDDGYRLRPNVVWFGESVPFMQRAIKLVEQADIVVVVGTSLAVYPAADLIHYAVKATHKIIVDPNADQFKIPHDFVKIPLTAVQAVTELKKYL